MRLLLVEDSSDYARLVAAHAAAAGMVVDHVPDLEQAEAAVATFPYDLVILDRRLPDGDGVRALPRLRRRRPGLRVLMLTALDGTPERVGGLDAGADDYVVKPVPMAELFARVRACLRRPGGDAPEPAACGRLSFDAAERTVRVDGAPARLRRGELAVLEALIARAGRVVLRETLDAAVFAADDAVTANALEAHVSRLRARLAALDAGVEIHTVRGVGYLMTPA